MRVPLAAKMLRCLAGGMVLAAISGSLIAADDKIEVAAIIDKAAAESILDTQVKDPTPVNVEGKDGYYSKCNYYSFDARRLLILRVYRAAPGFDPKQEIEQVRASSGLTKSVSGLGDKAELSSGTVAGLTLNVTMLYVAKGDTLVTVGLRGLEEETAIATAKNVAQKILERL